MELPVKQFQTRAEQAFVDLFNAAEQGLPGAGNPWVADLRAKAIDAYGMLGLPHRRVEAWKYTDLRSKLTEALPLARATGVAVTEAEIARAFGADIAALDAYRLVIVEGELRSDLSSLAGLKAAGAEVVSIAEALQKPPRWLKDSLGKINPQDRDPVVALNLALMSGGVGLRLAKGVSLDKPVHVMHLDGGSEPSSVITRSVVLIEEGASLDLLESYASLGDTELQRNAVTEIEVGNKASLNHVKLQKESGTAFHLVTWLLKLDTDANYKAFQFSTGAVLSRSQIYAAFTGEGSALDVSGALLMRGHQHCDTTLHCRASRAALRKPRAVQGGARQRGAWRVPGQDHRLARRAEDRRQADGASPAALRDGRVRTQSRSLRSSPTTWSAATARPLARSTRICCFISSLAAFRRFRPARF